ncbi:MAG: hypothetical protein DI539_28300, partial [Flavobacterium psychrophilum]
QPKLTINNSQIYNSLNFGIYGRHAVINGDNLVANNAGEASIALAQGGTANFRQCTFANYFSSFNQVPVAITDNADVAVPNPTTGKWEIVTRVSDVVANFDNCILYGSSNLGVSHIHEYSEDVSYTTKFNHCLIKIVDTANQLRNNPLYPSNANNPEQALYSECIIAKSSINDRPDFLDPQNNKLTIGADSAANGTADAAIATAVGADILGTPRQSPYDIGAYESIVFSED